MKQTIILTLALATIPAITISAQETALNDLRAGLKDAAMPATPAVAPATAAEEAAPAQFDYWKTVFARLPEKNIVDFELAKKEYDFATLPYNARLIMTAFKTKIGIMENKERKIRLALVEEPANIGALLDEMAAMANIATNEDDGLLGTPEYGLALYVDENGKPHYAIARGKATISGGFVAFNNAIRTPDGVRMILMGFIAHTHPFGAPTPSAGDFSLIRHFQDDTFKQHYSFLAVPGNSSVGDRSVMFDYQGKTYATTGKLRDLAVVDIFDITHMGK